MPPPPTASKLEAYRAAQAAAKLRLEARQLATQRGRPQNRDRLVALEIAASRHQEASDAAFAHMRARRA